MKSWEPGDEAQTNCWMPCYPKGTRVEIIRVGTADDGPNRPRVKVATVCLPDGAQRNVNQSMLEEL